MSYGEYYQARVMHYSMQDKGSWHTSDFFLKSGITQSMMDAMSEMRSQFAPDRRTTQFHPRTSDCAMASN